MNIGARLDGGMEMTKRLQALPSATTAAHQRTALVEGAELIRAEASDLAPRGHGEHIADHIVIDPLTDTELDRSTDFVSEQAAVLIGPERRFFYGYFLEFGTSKMSARPFMRPAVDTKARPALAVALSRLWELILAVSGGRATGTIGTGRNL